MNTTIHPVAHTAEHESVLVEALLRLLTRALPDLQPTEETASGGESEVSVPRSIDHLLKWVSVRPSVSGTGKLPRGKENEAFSTGIDHLLTDYHMPVPVPQPAARSRDKIGIIRAAVGNTIRMIPVTDVICFESTEKYVNVVTASGEALVRMSLRDVMSKIDASDFRQIHRSIVVNFNCVLSATRDEMGHYSLALRGLDRPVKVSRAFSHLSRAM